MVLDIDKRVNNTLTLSLGGNMGDVQTNFINAINEAENELGRVIKKSSLYKTAAWGNEEQPDFLNQVVVLDTNCSPHECLQKVLEIEMKLGRIRAEKWGERIIDIDILFDNNEIIDTTELKVPHPYIQDRNFILVPLSEVSGQFIHPLINKTIETLRIECNDSLIVSKQC